MNLDEMKWKILSDRELVTGKNSKEGISDSWKWRAWQCGMAGDGRQM